MDIFSALFFVLIAGVINGSFALPTKYVARWRFENIWLQYAIWAFIILPWVAVAILVPHVFQVYASTPSHLLLIMIIGGFLFGAGQVGFAFAINMIGIGLAFVICLGLGTGFGFLLPLVFQHPDQILTPFGFATIVGTVLAIIGLVFSTCAGKMRDDERRRGLENLPIPESKRFYLVGVLLAVIAGLFSAGQNFSFSLTAQMQQIALSAGTSKLGASIIMWPGFLVCTFIPYAIYMLYLHNRNKSFACYYEKGTGRYFLLALIMGVCWFGSLIFYSKSAQLIGKLGPVVGWPMFMVLVILTSNFWGWKHKEWEGCSRRVKYTIWAGLGFLILSVIALGYSSYFHA